MILNKGTTMMNKILLIIGLLLISTTNAQETLSKKEQLIQDIEQDITGLKRAILFSKMRLEISLSTATKDFDENDFSNFSDRVIKADDKEIEQFFNSLKPKEETLYPYTMLRFTRSALHLEKLLDMASHYGYDINTVFKAIPTKVTYFDGTSENIKDKTVSYYTLAKKYPKDDDGRPVLNKKATEVENYIQERYQGFLNERIALKSTKYIKNISYDFVLPLHTKSIYYVNHGKEKIHTKYGDIENISFSGNVLSFTIPKSMEGRLTIFGLYKDGRVLADKSGNSYTFVSKDQMAYYNQLIEVLKAEKKLVQEGKIKTKKAVRAYFDKHKPEEKIENLYQKQNIKFSGPLHQVVFSVKDDKIENKIFSKTYDITYDNDESDYKVAIDLETTLRGIINKQGEWIVKPTYEKSFGMINKYFFIDQNNYDKESVLFFNTQTNQLKTIPYKMHSQTIYHDRYVLVRGADEKLNVFDIKQWKILPNMRFDYVEMSEDFWLVENDGKYGVMKKDFTPLIPIEAENKIILQSDGFFYTKIGSFKQDIYNQQGQNITKGRFDDVSNWGFRDGLLMVETFQLNDKGKTVNKKYYFIDGDGNIVIDLAKKGLNYPRDFQENFAVAITKTDGYVFIDKKGNIAIDLEKSGWYRPGNFDGGVAIVRDKQTRYYGIINTQGEIVVPFIYIEIPYGFFKDSNLAYAESHEAVRLIDRTGKVIKTFKDMGQYHISDDKNCALLIYSGSICYDSFGNVSNKKRKK